MARRRKTNYPPTSFESGGGPAHHGEGSEPPVQYPPTSFESGGGPAHGPSTPTTSSQAAAASSAAASAQAGPTQAESSTIRAAQRQQAKLIQQYALNNEQSKLEDKHYEFDQKGRITKQKATNDEIHADLVKARGNVARTSARLFNNKRVQAANTSGRVLGPKRIKRIDSRITEHHQAVQQRATQLRHDAPEMSKTKSVATAKKLIFEEKHPGKVYNVGSGESASPRPIDEYVKSKWENPEDKSYDIFINPKTGKPDRFSNYNQEGYVTGLLEDLTGAKTYGQGQGGLGNIAETVGTAGSLIVTAPAAIAARGVAVAKAASKLLGAERSVVAAEEAAIRAGSAPGFVTKASGARVVGTGAERTGELAAGLSRGERLAALSRGVPTALKARYAKPARSVRLARRQGTFARKGVPAIVGIGPTPHGLTAGEAYLNVLADPEKRKDFLATSTGVIGSMPAAMLAPVKDTLEGHPETAIQSIVDYGKQYGELFSGDVSRAEEAITKHLGVVPILTGVLGATAVGRTLGARGPKLPSFSQRTVDALAHDATYGKTKKIRDEARTALTNSTLHGEPLAARHGGRKRQAEAGSIAGEMQTGQHAREQREGGSRVLGVGPRQTLDESIGRLNKKKPLTEDVGRGDVLGTLMDTGIRAETKDKLGKLQAIRDDLRDPSKEISREAGTTRDILDAILAHPEVLKDKQLLTVLRREGKKEDIRSIERHSARTGTIQTTPDPLDQPVRLQRLARNEGILQPHERPHFAETERPSEVVMADKYERGAEMVPIAELKNLREWDREKVTKADLDALEADIRKNGIREALIVEYDPKTGTARLGEGNARLAAAERLGLKEVPVRVMRKGGMGTKARQKGAFAPRRITEPREGYVPGDLRPSEIGLGKTKSERGGEVKPKPGQPYEAAVKEKVQSKRAEAKSKDKQAKNEKTKEQGTKKELAARRVADARRESNKTKSRKIRRLEKRRDAWIRKAKGKSPTARKKIAAKVKDLKREIREAKATLRIAHSPKRLETVRRMTEHRAKAKALRAEAKALREEAKTLEQSTHGAQMRKAKRLEIAAEGLRAKGKDAQAAILQDQANRIRAAVEADRTRIRDEFGAEVNARIEREGYAQPIYRGHSDISTRGDSALAARRFLGAKGGKKERFREGVLAEEGRIDESTLTLITNSLGARAAIAEWWRQANFLEKEAWSHKGVQIFDGAEVRRLQEAGKVPAGHDPVALSDFAQGVQRSDKWSRKMEQAHSRAIATAGKGQRKLYVFAGRAARAEYERQGEGLGAGFRVTRALSRLQTLGMLATSTAWFAFQFPATALVMLARNPNPVAWARAITRNISTYRNMQGWERVNFNAHFGGNPADFLAVGENVRGITESTVNAMKRSADIAAGTTSGRMLDDARNSRMLNAVWDNARHGGPLISINRKYESFQRRMMAMLEMDRLTGLNRKGELRLSARPKEFIAKTAHLNHLVRRDLDHLKGKSYAEQSRFYLDNPKRMREIENAVNDAYGNWASLTKAEKKLASVVVFYPFVRFSLRWMFWSFPKNNPVKAAIYLNMAQKNVSELQELLGGPPSFFSDWGKIVAHDDQGNLEEWLNLGRIAPGSNALVEGLGSDRNFNLTSLGRPLQPLITSFVAGGLGKNQYGEDLPEGVGWAEAVRNTAISLNPITRTLLGPKAAPPSEYSQLFKAIGGRDQGPLGALVPDLRSDTEADKEAARVGRMLEVAQNAPSLDEIRAAKSNGATHEEQKAMANEYARGQVLWNILQNYLINYGIRTKAEIDADNELYDKSSKQGQRLVDRAMARVGLGDKPTKSKPTPGEGGGYGSIKLPGGSGGYGDIHLPEGYGGYGADHTAPGGTGKQTSSTSKRTSTSALAANPPTISREQVHQAIKEGRLKRNSSISPERRTELSNAARYYVAKDDTTDRLSKAASKAVTIDAPLSADQMEFAKAFSKAAGVSPRFAAAAVLYEGGNNTPGDQNWLNIGWTGSGRAEITNNPVWQGDPAEAGKRTGEWLNGQWGQQDGYVAADAIQAITSNKGDEAQGKAWASSGWAASGAGPLLTIDQVSASTKPIPKELRKQAEAFLGKEQVQQIIASGGAAPAAAPAEPHLVKGFLKNIVKSAGLPTAEDLGVKNDNVVLGNIHPELQKALIKLAKQTGLKPEVNEGFRTYDYQASLDATPGLYAASAGTSNHESGLAVDVDNHAQYSDEQLAAVGLRKLTPEGGADPEHLELIDMPPALVGPKAGEAATGSTGAVPSSSGGTSYAPSTSTSGGGVTTSGGTGIPSLKKKGSRPRFSENQLLRATQQPGGFNALLTGAAPPPAEQDATMAAMAEIAATRKRLLKR